ncbi:MAG: hypothetical protein WC284_12690 [Candidimonas sp.]
MKDNYMNINSLEDMFDYLSSKEVFSRNEFDLLFEIFEKNKDVWIVSDRDRMLLTIFSALYSHEGASNPYC